MSLGTLKYQPGTYLAFKLADRTRSKLMRDYAPQFDKVFCHHITVVFDLTEDKLKKIQLELSGEKVVVTGLATGEDIECFTAEIDGKSVRLDGGWYHITHSLTPPRKPVDSNRLLQSLKGQPQTVIDPIEIHGTFELLKK